MRKIIVVCIVENNYDYVVNDLGNQIKLSLLEFRLYVGKCYNLMIKDELFYVLYGNL